MGHIVPKSARPYVALSPNQLQRMSLESVRDNPNSHYSNLAQPRLSDSAAAPPFSREIPITTPRRHFKVSLTRPNRPTDRIDVFHDSHSTGQLNLRSNRSNHPPRYVQHAPHFSPHFSALNASATTTHSQNAFNDHVSVQPLSETSEAFAQRPPLSQSKDKVLHAPTKSQSPPIESDSARSQLLDRGTNHVGDVHSNLGEIKMQPYGSSATDTIRRPILYLTKYGGTNTWAADVFSLPHNAIRAECIDLYNILESIHARGRQVCVIELEEFYVWWTAFEVFVIEYFDFEADVLFPWVFSLAPTSGARIENEVGLNINGIMKQKTDVDSLLRNSLLARKEILLESIRQLNGTFELRRHVDTADIFETILNEVNDFVPKLLEYFHAQERHLPQLAAQTYSSSAKDVIAKKYVQYIRHGEAPQINIVLLSRWMDTETRDKWVRSHVRGYGRLMYRRWERKCEKSHALIAVRFHKRLQQSVRSVAASRLRRRTEFGEEIDDLSFGSFPSHGNGSIRSLGFVVGNRAFQNRLDGPARVSEHVRPRSRLRF